MDPDGITELLSVDDRNRPGTARAFWRADETGTYFLRLKSGDEFGSNTGTYRVRAREVDPPNDDFPNEIANAAVLELTAEAEAEVDYELDQDIFSVDVEAGAEYIAQVRTSTADRADIAQPVLEIRSSTGTVLTEIQSTGRKRYRRRLDSRLHGTTLLHGAWFRRHDGRLPL